MSDIVNDTGRYVELTQRYACFVCGAVCEATTQLAPQHAAFWSYPAGWTQLGAVLICDKHDIKLEVDGAPIPDWDPVRCYPRKKEQVMHGSKSVTTEKENKHA